MKRLATLVLLLPLWAFAQSSVKESERTIIKNGDNITVESRQRIQERNRTTFSDCELYQWKQAHGTGTMVRCNWSENDAMKAALTDADDGVIVEWYDELTRRKGSYTALTMLPSNDCPLGRELVARVKYSGAVERSVYTMCYNQATGRWHNFKGY